MLSLVHAGCRLQRLLQMARLRIIRKISNYLQRLAIAGRSRFAAECELAFSFIAPSVCYNSNSECSAIAGALTFN